MKKEIKNTDKQQAEQQTKSFDWLKEYQWQKGQSGNPKGRPKGKTLKEWVRDFLMEMSEDARLEFLKTLSPDTIWKMAEGQPHFTTDITSGGKPIPLLSNLNVYNNDSDKKDKQIDKTTEDNSGGDIGG